MTISPKDWYDEYYKSDDVIKYFTEDRKYTYSKVADILYSYKIKTVLDIGTSTGIMIKTLLQKGIDAYGVDFDLLQLKEIHKKMELKNRMIYLLEDLELSQAVGLFKTKGIDIECITVLDTLRYINNFEALFDDSKRQGVKYILIKEVSTTLKNTRKDRDEWYLFSIRSLVTVAQKNGYNLLKLFLSKFIPVPIMCYKIPYFLNVCELSPTFTVVLKLNEK